MRRCEARRRSRCETNRFIGAAERGGRIECGECMTTRYVPQAEARQLCSLHYGPRLQSRVPQQQEECMARRLLSSSMATAALCVSVAAFGQTTGQNPTQSTGQAESQTMTQPHQPSDRSATKSQVTLVGCVQRESDYRKAHSEGRGGALGMGAGVDNEFVLTEASPASRASQMSSTSSSTGATSAAGTATTTSEPSSAATRRPRPPSRPRPRHRHHQEERRGQQALLLPPARRAPVPRMAPARRATLIA
jgi:hypothetical protein